MQREVCGDGPWELDATTAAEKRADNPELVSLVLWPKSGLKTLLVIGVVPVELRAKIQGMNARIVSFQHEKVPLAQENVVIRYYFAFCRGLSNSQPFRGWADYRPRF